MQECTVNGSLVLVCVCSTRLRGESEASRSAAERVQQDDQMLQITALHLAFARTYIKTAVSRAKIDADQTRTSISCSIDPNSTTPQAVRLAFLGDSTTAAAVSFSTCAAGVPLVSLQGGVEPQVFAGESSRPHERYHHNVVLAPLTPATTYTYVVALRGAPETSVPFKFSTCTPGAGFVAAVVGDLGVNNSAATLSALSAVDYNFTLHVGDVSYADDYDALVEPSSGRGYEDVYDEFQARLQPIASRAAYMVSPGNHDVSCHILTDAGCPDGLRNFSAFRHRWRMPSRESGAIGADNMWYSYRVGPVHFASLSTETDFPGAPTTPHTSVGGGKGGGFGDQLAWLEADLAAAHADPSVRWVVAIGHRPMYASKARDWPLRTPEKVQAAFEPLFHRYGVALYLCGHKHYYERTAAVFAGATDPNGTVHVVNGAAGNNEGIDASGGVRLPRLQPSQTQP